jgi:hypothetical protein
MKQLVLWLLIIIPLGLSSQTKQDDTDFNPRYFEDQFYAGVTYNFILNQPEEDVNQQNISYGLQAGFIKDIPFNKNRTVGLGIGLGLGLNTYYSNIRAIDQGGDISYAIVNDANFRRSKLEMHLVEFPVEFRWRNSDASTYNFWRIYAGVKFGYAFNARSKYVLDGLKESFKNTDIDTFQYGLTFNFGYHNFNIHAYYSLSKLYNDGVTLNGNEIDISPLRIGLIFYIL